MYMCIYIFRFSQSFYVFIFIAELFMYTYRSCINFITNRYLLMIIQKIVFLSFLFFFFKENICTLVSADLLKRNSVARSGDWGPVKAVIPFTGGARTISSLVRTSGRWVRLTTGCLGRSFVLLGTPPLFSSLLFSSPLLSSPLILLFAHALASTNNQVVILLRHTHSYL